MWDEIRVHKDEARILLAGHEPLFSRLTAYLLGSPNLQVDFKKGAIACIELERFPVEPHGVLRWMLTSKLGLRFLNRLRLSRRPALYVTVLLLVRRLKILGRFFLRALRIILGTDGVVVLVDRAIALP